MDNKLREELLALQTRGPETGSDDRAISGLFDGSVEDEILRKNVLRLKEIVDQRGWPGIEVVGEEGCEAAWLIAQNASSLPEVQKDFLRRLQDTVERGDAPPLHEAYLLDRILFNQDRPQLYGLIFDWNAEGELSAWIDQDNLADQRRKELGLPTVEEATEKARRDADRKGVRPPEDIDEYHRKRRQWAREVGWLRES